MHEHKNILPNSKGAFILGIIGLCISFTCCFCYGSFAGLVLTIIGLVLSGRALKIYQADPGMYSEKSYNQAKTGKLLNLIGLIVAILFCIFYIIYLYLFFTHTLPPALQDQVDHDVKRMLDFD